MDKKKILIILTSLAFFFIVPTLLEAKEKKFSFGFSAGLCNWPSEVFRYMKVYPQDYFWRVYGAINTLEQDIELKALYNLDFQYNFSSRLGIQVEIGHQKADYMVLFVLIPLAGARLIYPRHHLSWSVSTIFLNLIFRARKSENKIIPYGLLGLGFCSVRGEEDYPQDYRIEIRSTMDLGLKAGAGMTFYLMPKIIPIGFDLRAFVQVLGADIGGYYSPYYGSNIVAGGWNLVWGIGIGLKYRF